MSYQESNSTREIQDEGGGHLPDQLTLINDLQRLARTIENQRRHQEMLIKRIEQLDQQVKENKNALALNAVQSIDSRELIANIEKASFDGQFIWKIDHFTEKMQQAKTGQQTSYYSSPFYTSRDGYKLCLRVYPNGDGTGRNTHLSVFLVVMKGEYDALLTWPFLRKVTISLLDQSSNARDRENFSDSFRPDPNSSSFQRPRSEMNIPSGLPLFIPLAKLLSEENGFIRDNCIFLKVVIS